MIKFQEIKKIFLDIVSFGSPQAIVFNISSILIGLAIIPTGDLEKSPLKCIFKHFLLPLIFKGNCPTSGIFADCNCPACGITRGVSRLLHGDIKSAYSYNKLVPLVFLTLMVLLIINLIRSVKYYRKTGKIYGANFYSGKTNSNS
jgi:hypothetical protein